MKIPYKFIINKAPYIGMDDRKGQVYFIRNKDDLSCLSYQERHKGYVLYVTMGDLESWVRNKVVIVLE